MNNLSLEQEIPLFSIVILNYNGFEKNHLKTCLESVLKTIYPKIEIILVDNGSHDNSVEFVKTNFPEVKVVRLKKNYGTSIGYNVGVVNSKGKYVAIINNDVTVEPSWLSRAMDYIERIPNVVAADPKFKNFFNKEKFDDSAAAGRWIDYFGNNYTRGANEVDNGQYNMPVYIIGVLTFFDREVFLKSGGFDPYYIFGYEDIDLGWRLILMGYDILYIPSSIIFHKSGGTTRNIKKELNPHLYYLNKRNRLITIIKNYSVSNLLLSLYITLLEYTATLIYYAFSGKKAYSKGIFYAMTKTFKDLRYIVKKRSKIQALRKRSDKEVKKRMIPYSGVIFDIMNRVKKN